MVALACVLNGIEEIFFATTLAARDQCFYVTCCKACVPEGADPLAAFKSHKLMRTRNAYLESVAETCFVIIDALVVLAVFDISKDGDLSPSASLMILNVVLQIVIGAVVDLTILCWLVGFEKEPVPPLAVPLMMGFIHWMIDRPPAWKVRVFLEGYGTLFLAAAGVAGRFGHVEGALPPRYWPAVLQRLALRAAAILSAMAISRPLLSLLQALSHETVALGLLSWKRVFSWTKSLQSVGYVQPCVIRSV